MHAPKIEVRRRGRQRVRWVDGATDPKHRSLSELWEIVKDREAWCAAVHRSQRVRHGSQRVRHDSQLNNNDEGSTTPVEPTTSKARSFDLFVCGFFLSFFFFFFFFW